MPVDPLPITWNRGDHHEHRQRSIRHYDTHEQVSTPPQAAGLPRGRPGIGHCGRSGRGHGRGQSRPPARGGQPRRSATDRGPRRPSGSGRLERGHRPCAACTLVARSRSPVDVGRGRPDHRDGTSRDVEYSRDARSRPTPRDGACRRSRADGLRATDQAGGTEWSPRRTVGIGRGGTRSRRRAGGGRHRPGGRLHQRRHRRLHQQRRRRGRRLRRHGLQWR